MGWANYPCPCLPFHDEAMAQLVGGVASERGDYLYPITVDPPSWRELESLAMPLHTLVSLVPTAIGKRPNREVKWKAGINDGERRGRKHPCYPCPDDEDRGSRTQRPLPPEHPDPLLPLGLLSGGGGCPIDPEVER